MVSKIDSKKFQQVTLKQWKLLKSKPEMGISLIALLLLVVGIISAVLLTNVEQDIRQQAQTNQLYNVSSVGAGCSSDQTGSFGCTNNHKVVCDGFQWRSAGGNCSSDVVSVENEILLNSKGKVCGVAVALNSNGKCGPYYSARKNINL